MLGSRIYLDQRAVMALSLVSLLLAGFAPPPMSRLAQAPARAAATTMQFKMPELPKFEGLGGIEVEAFGDKFAKAGDLRLMPSDIQFTDKDGDVITLRGVGGGKVDYYVGKELKIKAAVLTTAGSDGLQVTGKIKKGTYFAPKARTASLARAHMRC